MTREYGNATLQRHDDGSADPIRPAPDTSWAQSESIRAADDDPWKECMPTIAKGIIAATILIGIGIAIGAVIWA